LSELSIFLDAKNWQISNKISNHHTYQPEAGSEIPQNKMKHNIPQRPRKKKEQE